RLHEQPTEAHAWLGAGASHNGPCQAPCTPTVRSVSRATSLAHGPGYDADQCPSSRARVASTSEFPSFLLSTASRSPPRPATSASAGCSLPRRYPRQLVARSRSSSPSKDWPSRFSLAARSAGFAKERSARASLVWASSSSSYRSTSPPPSTTLSARSRPEVERHAARALAPRSSCYDATVATTPRPRKPVPGRSLAEMFPKIAAQWGAHKNRGLTPFDITHGSGREVWWRCGKGGDHIWLQQVTVRTRPGSGCPFCAGKRPSITNSLATRAPMVAAEWHRTRNRPLTPKDVTTGTSRFVWWRCAKARDHEWGATIYDRVARKTACPFCAGHRVSSTSSLACVRPDIAKMWHPTKNRSLTPHDVLPNSGRSVWWRCTEAPDHVWRGPIANKIRHGCPFCKGRRLCCSNSLAVVAPEVAAQWHGPKNGRLRPSDVFHRSGRIVWWKCDAAADHEWRTAVVNRRKMGPGCPFCSGKWLAPSSSLAARFPALAAQWHRLKNRSLRPIDVHPGTNRHVWWKCAAGPDHQWRADIRVRVRYPRCPFCAG